ncbi:MAG: putative bifunctional diguanylate cyclase/phosphodiesterase, partial [Acidimicrobiales bacterium]
AAPESAAPEVAHRMRLVTAVVTGAALVTIAGVAWADPSLDPAGVIIALAVVEAFSWGSTILLQPKGESDLWQLDEAIFVCALVLVSPLGVLVTFAVGVPLGLLVARHRPVMLIYSGAIVTVAAAAGLGVARVVSPLDADVGPRLILAMLVGGSVLALTNEVLMGVWSRAVSRRPFWPELAANLRFRFRWSPWISSGGVLLGLAGRSTPWALAFAIPPLAAFQLVLSEHLKARRDRERTLGLFTAANEAHASVRLGEVEEAFTQAAARLLRCGSARILGRPPERGEWGVRLAVAGPEDQWLVVADRHSDEPLDADDLALLETMAAVGSSALENARLVDEIRHRAVHDALTDLPNQLLFDDRVEQAITLARQQEHRFAVAVLDLDSFKKVNDSLGHSVGDELLSLVARRLTDSVQPLDTVARLGGDLFTILFPAVDGPQAAGAAAERVLAAVRRPVRLGGQELFMTASLGIAFYPEDGTSHEHLLRNAEAAMHRAKEVGLGGYQIYAATMNALAHLRLALESELHNAVERDELTLRYQPQVELASGRIAGVEALLRWNHPVLGLLGPADFLNIAEESGFIIDIDHWVMERACRQGQEWLAAGFPAIRISVNLSGRHFQAPDRVVGAVVANLASTGIPASMLELEVTESVAVNESEEVAGALNRVRELGVGVAIDDFGTGYSMLGRLQRFPVDRLKIDRSFVSEVRADDAEAPLIVAIIAMARSLNLKTVAEGVETEAQRAFLRRHGCDEAQGYLFAEPRDPDGIAVLLRSASAAGRDVTASRGGATAE